MAKDYFAHETAVIDKGCVIGQGTRIWHFRISCRVVQLEKTATLDKM